MKHNETHLSMLTSPMRQITGKVEYYKDSTLLKSFKHTDALSNFKVTRTASKKFFGFGVTQSLEVKLIDKNREISIENGNQFKIKYTVDNNEYIPPYPDFIITDEVTRDENTNELTIKAVDRILYEAEKHTISEVELPSPVTFLQLINLLAVAIGCSGGASFVGTTGSAVNQLNVNGNETIREILDDVAEASQTVYYAEGNRLVFKRIQRDGTPVVTISKADYFTLTAKDSVVLNAIACTNELGDNIIKKANDAPYTQIIHDNCIWYPGTTLDVGYHLGVAVDAMCGISMTPFNLRWRGNYLLEIGDKIKVVKKNNETFTTYLLEEQTTYNGGLTSTISWEYDTNQTDTFANPSNLGEALKHTTAVVDKVNQNITLTVNKIEGLSNQLTQLELDTDSISASVQQIQTSTNDRFDAIGGEIETLTNRVEATMTPEAVEIKIQEAIGEGVGQVTTETGFTFNDIGLTISKSDSEMTTTITEDGMSVYKDGEEVLTADNTGVKAIDLHALTYLHIGTYSRLQDYDGGRTGCFWIKG